MPYTNCVSLEFAINQLDLFDNIEFKYLKHLFIKDIDREDWDFEVDIEDIALPYSSANCCMCKTVVKFELENPEYIEEGGFYPHQKEKSYSFTKEYVYNGSSEMALIFMDLCEESEDEEEESEEEEEEEPDDLMECGFCGEQFSLSKVDFQYLPSKEDEEKEQMLGMDLCMNCFCKVEHKYSYVEDIEEE